MKIAVERKRPFPPFAVDFSPFWKSTRERYSSFQRVFKNRRFALIPKPRNRSRFPNALSFDFIGEFYVRR